MLVSLSYPLSERTPFYSGLPAPSLEQIFDLAKGHDCNSFYFKTSNHAGTHVDAPRHFNASGRTICDYEPNELVFHRCVIADLPLRDGELITASHIEGLALHDTACDLLLLRTGSSEKRVDPRRYVDHGPGFSGAGAAALMARLPQLRALAVDFVSIASMHHMEEGCEAHRVFLGCRPDQSRSVLLIEDVRLPADLQAPDRVILAPWLFEGLDSAPCNVLAEYLSTT